MCAKGALKRGLDLCLLSSSPFPSMFTSHKFLLKHYSVYVNSLLEYFKHWHFKCFIRVIGFEGGNVPKLTFSPPL